MFFSSKEVTTTIFAIRTLDETPLTNGSMPSTFSPGGSTIIDGDTWISTLKRNLPPLLTFAISIASVIVVSHFRGSHFGSVNSEHQITNSPFDSRVVVDKYNGKFRLTVPPSGIKLLKINYEGDFIKSYFDSLLEERWKSPDFSQGFAIPVVIYRDKNVVLQHAVDLHNVQLTGSFQSDMPLLQESAGKIPDCAYAIGGKAFLESFAPTHAEILMNSGISQENLEKCVSTVGARLFGFILDAEYENFESARKNLISLIGKKNMCGLAADPQCLK
ncbi:hypothetical protein [Oryzibacter oryziterrae]|uniref:hypothetical protein n=1 Tax=Oryzibacter oryziterrae TaxID=2766474 RepID=UPI001F19D967|nr:hypothetical protein [Oryzibacter oryziterrae]